MWISSLNGATPTDPNYLLSTSISTDDGITWNQLTSTDGTVVNNFVLVVCNGTTWIACGTTALPSPQISNVTIYRSINDGKTWPVENILPIPIFGSNTYNAFACNGTGTWVGGGTNNAANLIYSVDNGVTWNPSANGNTIFGNSADDAIGCMSVAWYDATRKWVAVGLGISVVAYSTNGIHWTPYNPYDVVSVGANAVAAIPASMPMPAPNSLHVQDISYHIIYLDSNGAPGPINNPFAQPQYTNGLSGYTVYVFSDTSTLGTVIPTSTFNVSYLIVGGGGCGGHGKAVSPGQYSFVGGGGGGAGGLLTNYGYGSILTLQPSSSYNLMIGVGGTTANPNGTNSTFDSLSAVGGGGGGNIGNDGNNGGSGGGGGCPTTYLSAPTKPGNGTSEQGCAGGHGGDGILLNASGGGGGGAGGVGYDSALGIGGNGGNGLSFPITGTPKYYAGGGGGGGIAGYPESQGGQGGGGNGGVNSNGSHGIDGLGGGGGGGTNGGGTGGSGTIIIRFRSYF